MKNPQVHDKGLTFSPIDLSAQLVGSRSQESYRIVPRVQESIMHLYYFSAY